MLKYEKTLGELMVALLIQERTLKTVPINRDHPAEEALTFCLLEMQVAERMLKLGFQAEWQLSEAAQTLSTIPEGIRPRLVEIVQAQIELRLRQITEFLSQDAPNDFQSEFPGICICREYVHRYRMAIALLTGTEPALTADCDAELREVIAKSWCVAAVRATYASELPDPASNLHWWITEKSR